VLAGIEALTIHEEADAADAVRECRARWLAADHEVLTTAGPDGGDMNDAILQSRR
jgi:hypothetical protein